jgi:hypothetical protein
LQAADEVKSVAAKTRSNLTSFGGALRALFDARKVEAHPVAQDNAKAAIGEPPP